LHNVGITALELLGLGFGSFALGSLTSSLWIWTGERNVAALPNLKKVYKAVAEKDMVWLRRSVLVVLCTDLAVNKALVVLRPNSQGSCLSFSLDSNQSEKVTTEKQTTHESLRYSPASPLGWYRDLYSMPHSRIHPLLGPHSRCRPPPHMEQSFNPSPPHSSLRNVRKQPPSLIGLLRLSPPSKLSTPLLTRGAPLDR
jgi:hypothetical protein